MDTILSHEGVTQVGPLFVVLYGLRLSVMAQQIVMQFSVYLQSWYADDFSTAGAVTNLLPNIAHIEDMGTDRGFYLQSEELIHNQKIL